MKKEILIPLLYILRREHYRVKVRDTTSIFRIATAMILNYLWVPAFLLIFLKEYANPAAYYTIILHLLAFFILYETGYILSDNISVKYETKGIKRKIFKYLPSKKSVLLGVIIRIALLTGALIIFNKIFTAQTAYLFVFTALVFWLHVALKEKQRVPTFISLRILKGFVPYAFLTTNLNKETTAIIIAGLAGSAVFYTIEYASRKWKGNININFYSDKSTIIEILLSSSLIITTAILIEASAHTVGYIIMSIIITRSLIIIAKKIKRKNKKIKKTTAI